MSVSHMLTPPCSSRPDHRSEQTRQQRWAMNHCSKEHDIADETQIPDETDFDLISTHETKCDLSISTSGASDLQQSVAYDVTHVPDLTLVDDEWRSESYLVAVGRLCEHPIVPELHADIPRVVLGIDDDGVQEPFSTHDRNNVPRNGRQLLPQQLTHALSILQQPLVRDHFRYEQRV